MADCPLCYVVHLKKHKIKSLKIIYWFNVRENQIVCCYFICEMQSKTKQLSIKNGSKTENCERKLFVLAK